MICGSCASGRRGFGQAGGPAPSGSPSMVAPEDQPPRSAPELTADWWLGPRRCGARSGAESCWRRSIWPSAAWPSIRATWPSSTERCSRWLAREPPRRRRGAFRLSPGRDRRRGHRRAASARIAKDAALSEDGPRRRRAARAAETLRRGVPAHRRLLPGDQRGDDVADRRRAGRSRELASTVLGLLAARVASRTGQPPRPRRPCCCSATGRRPRRIAQAASRHGDDYGALASTRRQLRLICEALAVDAELLRPLAGPVSRSSAGTGSGGRASGARSRPRPSLERPRASPEALERIPRGTDTGRWRAGRTSCGRRGCSRAAVSCTSSCRSRSGVRRAVGGVLRTRLGGSFPRCLAAATDVRYATDDAYLGDEVLFRYGAELAMGLALLRARYLDAEVRQLPCGTASRRGGRPGPRSTSRRGSARGAATIVAPRAGEVFADTSAERVRDAGRSRRRRHGTRACRAGDPVRRFRGFSKLGDEQAVTFAGSVLGALARVIEPLRGRGAVTATPGATG